MPPIGISLFRGLRRLQETTGLDHRTEDISAMAPRPVGPLIWLYLDDLETYNEISGVLQYFKHDHPDLKILVSSAKQSTERATSIKDMYQAPPNNVPGNVKLFLDHWKPDIILWMDNKLDPIILTEAFERDIATHWINADFSIHTQGQWRLWPGAAKSIIKKFDAIIANTDQAAQTILKYGAPEDRLLSTGPLQPQIVAPNCNMAERDAMANAIGARPIWLALECSDAEIEMIVEAHKQLSHISHRLLLILHPKHDKSGPALARKLEAQGWSLACRSLDQDPGPDTQIYIADLPDEQGLWMHLAPITFAGGSFAKGTDINPFNPAAFGSAVVYGPNINNHQAAYDQLHNANGALQVQDVDSLIKAITHILSPHEAAALAMSAWDITTRGAKSNDLLKEILTDTLEQAGY